MYSTQHSYAPSADTLYVDIKDIIEQKFPRLEVSFRANNY